MSDKQTRQITQPIHYDDGKVIHACESSEVLPGVRMVWTKCYLDVPDNRASRSRPRRRRSPAQSAWRRQVSGMCGRFQATTSAAELARVFKTTGPLPNLQQRYNAAPTQSLPTVLCDRESGERRLQALRWGLIPYWAKDAKIAHSTVNAKAETVATAPAFRDAFKRRRCLVPADGFYEWQKTDGKTKQPYRFTMADGAPFAFAGLWERWREPASGETVRSFTIITTTPNALCAPVHNRMPVILGAGDYQAWLGEVPASGDALRALLRPFPAERMAAHTIGPRISKVKNDDATLIERWNST